MGEVQTKQCMCWKVWRCHVADWPYMTAFEIIIAGPHCLCVRSVLASNAHVLRHALVHDNLRPMGNAISQDRQICDQYRVINMNLIQSSPIRLLITHMKTT